jgi:hypothetical protein
MQVSLALAIGRPRTVPLLLIVAGVEVAFKQVASPLVGL